MAFKEDLGEALVKAVEFYNGGCDPNEAIVKSAQAMHFNLDQTDRLVEKFNTARTINYFERNPDDRTQNFDIASKEKVAEYLFGDRAEKKASVSSDEYYDYSCYDRRELDYFAPRAEKTAEDGSGNPDLEDRHGVSGYSTESLQRMVLKRASDHAEQARFIRDQIGMIGDEIATELSKIASSVASGYDPGMRYAMFKAACGDIPVFKSLDDLVPDYVKKEASKHDRMLKRSNVVDLGDMQPLADELDKIAEISMDVEGFEKEAERHEAYRRNIVCNLTKTAGNNNADNKSSKDTEYDAAKDFLNIGSDVIGKPVEVVGRLGSGAAEGVAGKGLSDYLDSGFLGSTEDIAKLMSHPKKRDTTLSDHINNLRRSTILQDLYENDPILQEADPDALANAYQTVIQTSPEMSLNKEIVRAILRQSVNSMAVSPFDAKQWADLENVLGKNKAMASGKAFKQ